MFTKVLLTIYFISIIGCLINSVFRRKENRFPIFIYFLVVFILESAVLLFPGPHTNIIYSYAALFYMGFFTLYFGAEIFRLKKIVYFLGAISLISGFVVILKSAETFPTTLGIINSLLYIALSLLWFFDQIKNLEKVFIIKKQGFWISAALLFWSMIFLFRISMMYWLDAHDPQFLRVLHQIFMVAVVIMYIFFFIATMKNQKPVS